MLKVCNAELSQAMAGAASIVENRNIIPVLSMVRITTKGDALQLVTTNTDVEYKQNISCQSDQDVDFCVDARRLMQMALSSSAMVSMALTDRSLKVSSGRSRWVAPILPADQFPFMGFELNAKPFEIDGDDLSSILGRVMWAAAKDGLRYMLQGVHMGAGSFAATDGHVMAIMDSRYEWDMPSVIIPLQFAKAIRTIASGSCSMVWDARKMRVACGDVTLTGKMVDAEYPDYRRVIPGPSEPWAVNAKDFAGAVKRVRISSDEKTKKLRVRRADGAIQLAIEGSRGFKAEEDIPADCRNGFESALNSDYLLAMLSAIGEGHVSVEQLDCNSAFMFKPVTQDAHSSFTGVLMGMKI